MCVGFKGETAYCYKKLPLAALGPGTCSSCASPRCGGVQEYWNSAALSVPEGVTCLRECFASPLGALQGFCKVQLSGEETLFPGDTSHVLTL